MKKSIVNLDKEFWEQLDKKNTREFYKSFIGAVKLHIQHGQAVNTAKKAKILFKNDNAGIEYESKANMYFQRRNMHLQFIKQWLANHYEELNEVQRKNFEEFFKTDRYKEILAFSKKLMVQEILYSTISHEDTKEAFEKLNNLYKDLEGLKSLEDLYNYVQTQVDIIIKKRVGNPESIINWLCLLIILIFFGLALLLLIFLCIIFHIGCDQIPENALNILKLCGVEF